LFDKEEEAAAMMLSKHAQPMKSSARALSVMSSNVLSRNQSQQHQLQQQRTILGLVPAIDKRLYRMAKGVMPAISKTEQIALGCGTIGKVSLFY
jgi:hypothetical protein